MSEPTFVKRFAVSALSRIHKNNAIPGEIMIQKETGQVLIKTNSGDVISYSSLARFKNHIDTLTIMAFNLNISGDMLSIELDDIELPEVIQMNFNLLSEPLLIGTSLKKILVSIDLDCVEMSSNDGLIEHEPFIKIDLMFKKDEDIITSSINLLNTQNNMNVINVSNHINTADFLNYETYITGITVVPNPQMTEVSIKNILHSILVIREGI